MANFGFETPRGGWFDSETEVNMLELSIARIKELKGVPLVVWLLLSMCPEPVSKKWLERNSGYTNKPIQQACEYLKEQGLAVYVQDGWLLAEMAQGSKKPGGNNSTPIIINAFDFKDLKKEFNNNNKKSGKNSTTRKTGKPRLYREPSPAEALRIAELWQILAEAGVHRNDRTRAMLKIKHVTPGYLRAKLAEYKGLGLAGAQWAGMFIRAIEEAEPVPPTEENGHPGGCTCTECVTKRFFGH